MRLHLLRLFTRPMLLPIVQYNSPILRQRGAPIANFDSSLVTLVQDMVETMHKANGIGLAAQQVGQALQLCVLDLRLADKDFDWDLDGAHPPMDIFMPFAVINPLITVSPGTKPTVYEEGCLSFPEIRGDIYRPDEITVRYQDQFGIGHVMRCNGLLSRCVQHEADHLNGTLFIDRMEKAVRLGIERPIRELARHTREAAEAKKA
jgi:peptide deformylase